MVSPIPRLRNILDTRRAQVHHLYPTCVKTERSEPFAPPIISCVTLSTHMSVDFHTPT